MNEGPYFGHLRKVSTIHASFGLGFPGPVQRSMKWTLESFVHLFVFCAHMPEGLRADGGTNAPISKDHWARGTMCPGVSLELSTQLVHSMTTLQRAACPKPETRMCSEIFGIIYPRSGYLIISQLGLRAQGQVRLSPPTNHMVLMWLSRTLNRGADGANGYGRDGYQRI